MIEPEEVQSIRIGPMYQHGHLSIESPEVIQRLNLADCEFGVQIGEDGRVWVCVNGIAFLRFKPTPKGAAHQHPHMVDLPIEREFPSNMFRARCVCGWIGEACLDEPRARSFGEQHITAHGSSGWDSATDHG